MHRAAFTILYTQKLQTRKCPSFYTDRSLHIEAFRQKFFTQMRQMLLHTAFEHRCLSTKKHLPRYALTYTRQYTQKLWHREAFTQRIFYTQKLLHTQAFPQKLLHREAFEHRSFYTETPLHTEACTHGGFYAQKLLHRESFTHRRFPTEKTIPQSSFYTLRKITILRKFLTFGHHIVRKGCIQRWKIAIFDVGQSFCVKGLRLIL